MQKQSIHLKGFDDEGQPVYQRTVTISKTEVVSTFGQEDLEYENQRLKTFNEINSEANILKEFMRKPKIKEEALQSLINAGILYSDGTPREYDEAGDLIPLSKLER